MEGISLNGIIGPYSPMPLYFLKVSWEVDLAMKGACIRDPNSPFLIFMAISFLNFFSWSI